MSTVRNFDTAIKGNKSADANYCSYSNYSITANEPAATNTSNSQNSDSTTNISNAGSSQDSDPGSFISTSDCSTLSSPYIPSLTSMALTSSNISFEIKCNTDYSDPDADFMTVAVFTFEDCIAACASFNEVCVSGFDPSQPRSQSDYKMVSRTRFPLVQ